MNVMPREQISPLQRIYNLADLSEAGDEVTVAASAADLPRLAEWAGVEAVERFEGVVTLHRLSASRFHYQAVLTADVMQNCVVSLDPVRTHLERRFSRFLHLIPRSHRPGGGEQKSEVLTLASGDDEAPEEIESPRYDLAGPLLEELSLGIDPYPHAPGVEFKPPTGGEEGEVSPFAILQRLKRKSS